MKKLLALLPLILVLTISEHASSQGRPLVAPNTNVALTLKTGGSTPRPSGIPPFVRKRADLDKWHIGKAGLKSGPPPVGTQLFAFNIGAPPAVNAAAEINPSLHAPGSLFFDSSKGRLRVPRRGSTGLDEVVWIAMAPYALAQTTFDCTVTPGMKYSTAVDAYYLTGDRDELIGTTYGLSSSGTVSVIVDAISPTPDYVFFDLWSPDAEFELTGCKAIRTG